MKTQIVMRIIYKNVIAYNISRFFYKLVIKNYLIINNKSLWNFLDNYNIA